MKPTQHHDPLSGCAISTNARAGVASAPAIATPSFNLPLIGALGKGYLAAALFFAAGTEARDDWARLTWQANDGAGWTSGRLETTSRTVQIRLFAEWEAPAAMGFGNTHFDGTITTDHIAADSVSNFSWPWRVQAGRLPPREMRFGNVLKFDDLQDTLPPGQGPRWDIVGQAPAQFGGMFITDNPVSILAFDLTLDEVPGARLIDMIFRPGIPLIRLYTDEIGAITTPPTEVHNLEVFYIPAPSGAPALLAALALLRRRRSPG